MRKLILFVLPDDLNVRITRNRDHQKIAVFWTNDRINHRIRASNFFTSLVNAKKQHGERILLLIYCTNRNGLPSIDRLISLLQLLLYMTFEEPIKS